MEGTFWPAQYFMKEKLHEIQISVFINKVLLEHSHILLATAAYALQWQG